VIPEQPLGSAYQRGDCSDQPARVWTDQQVDAVNPLCVCLGSGGRRTGVIDEGQPDAGGLCPQPYSFGCFGPLARKRSYT
jgi:hypothetical protein